MPARVAVASGLLTVLLGVGWSSADAPGLDEFVTTCPLYLAASLFGVTTLLTLVLLWAGRPLDSDAPVVVYGRWLTLEYLAVAAWGMWGVYDGETTASGGWALVIVGTALAALVAWTTFVLRPVHDIEVRR